jgi:hypothetical protein
MKSLITAAALAAFLTSAGAPGTGRTVHQVGLTTTNTNWGTSFHPIQVPQHDPSLGALQAVTLCFRGATVRRFRVESLDSQPATVQLSGLSSAMVWRHPCATGQALGVRRMIFADQQFDLAAYDGATDFAGPSGADTLPLPRGMHAFDAVLVDPAEIACFVGTNSVTIPVELSFGTNVSGPGNLVVEAQGMATVSGMVIYDYSLGP